jgi:hypothetical protein
MDQHNLNKAPVDLGALVVVLLVAVVVEGLLILTLRTVPVCCLIVRASILRLAMLNDQTMKTLSNL